MTGRATIQVPEGYNTVNPFIITDNSRALTQFIVDVFGGEESPYALTYDGDGLSGCVQEVEWEQFGRLMERGRVGLLHGGEMQQPTFIREEGQAIRGLPDHRPVRGPS